MGNKASFMLQDEEINLISEETGFSPSQIERLYSRFTALDKDGNGSLSRQDCLAIPELAINPLCDRIVQMFFIDCDDDHDRINFRQFMNVLSTFLPSKQQPTISRQESLSRKQKQSLCHQAPLLFDSIDPTPFSRHSSFHDGFHDPHHHNTTNQHSVHYAASSNHIPSLSNGWSHHHHHHSFSATSTTINNNNLGLSGSSQQKELDSTAGSGLNKSASGNSITGSNLSIYKKPSFRAPPIDPDEPTNSQRRKLYFMFKIYDVNCDDLIDLEDLMAVLKMMVGSYVEEPRVRRIAERTLREADKNFDGYIDFEEFCSSFNRKDLVESLKVKFPHS